MPAAAPTLDRVHAGDLELAYRELGSGPPVLLLHGWPTSSFLWRDVMPAIARGNRVLALDLPGFGGSDKPLETRYDFEFFTRAIDGFLAAAGVDRVAIAGHDLGGPIAVRWALDNPEHVTHLALLNTLLYPDFDPTVMEFVTTLANPDTRSELTSAAGLESVMRLGLADEASLTSEVLAGVVDPFPDEESRVALAKAGIELQPDGFADLSRRLSELSVPVRVVYGEQDRVLPDVAETMARVKRDVPQAEVTAIPSAGHFVQEEAGVEVGDLLAAFFAESA
jgi:pimeloyl-ACP methyl ester carboxylesterase